MAKRGRKPKAENKKTYFGEQEEAAVDRYIASNNAAEKNEIYNSILKPAFIKMTESIIRRYKLYIPEEEFIDTFNDTLSFMLTKIDKYRREIYGYWEISNPSEKITQDCVLVDENTYKAKKENATDEDPKYILVEFSPRTNMEEYFYKYFVKETRHFKAYSYCGTISKNYLIQKIKQYRKKLIRNTSYDEISMNIVNDIRYSEDEEEHSTLAEELMKSLSKSIKTTLEDAESLEGMTENEKKVGNALLILLDNWEDVLDDKDNNNSNKLNKSSVLYFLREETRLNTKEIRDSMKKFKTMYQSTKKELLD